MKRKPCLFLIPFIILPVSVSISCAKKKVVKKDEQTTVKMEEEGDIIKVALDLNDDKVPDVWNSYKKKEDGSRILIGKKSDLNLDGKVDVITHYNDDGVILKEEIDADFDGRFDWLDYYENGKRIKSEIDKNFDGIFDTWKYFENEKISRKERDTNDDGKPDYFEYYEDEKVIRIGRDFNGDGVVDKWE